MTIFVGDIHGEFDIFSSLISRTAMDYPGSIIQVGDFGAHPGWLRNNPFVAPPRPVYWIDGNHEWFPDIWGKDLKTPLNVPDRYRGCFNRVLLPRVTEPTELYPNCIYIPRGTVMEIDGRTMAFLGGGDSVDKKYRTKGWDWFYEERVQFADADLLEQNAKGKTIDLMVTHVPPYYMLPGLVAMGGNRGKIFEEYAYSSFMVERAWRAIGKPPIVCGHFHLSFSDGVTTVLDINEMKEL